MISRLISFYIFLGILTGLYQSFWGRLRYEAMGTIFGKCLVWPVIWFPGFGEVLGMIVFVVLVIAFIIGRQR
ncbi:TPA: hypothetical protein G8N43_001483 [Salmonella enterica]|nr:hypothetical protein [Salmonella enterica subsp. enterica serovar Virchow]EIC5004622.1 hypothetical protein [Salmonella enterica]HAF2467675.1 hypothetical protein [Salmonella enterica]HAK8938644.1 hypothetical protein [Salmonella enterica]